MNPDFHLHQLNRPKDADVAQDVRAFQDQELQKSDDDAAILARIGKRQVLKVMANFEGSRTIADMMLEKLWTC